MSCSMAAMRLLRRRRMGRRPCACTEFHQYTFGSSWQHHLPWPTILERASSSSSSSSWHNQYLLGVSTTTRTNNKNLTRLVRPNHQSFFLQTRCYSKQAEDRIIVSVGDLDKGDCDGTSPTDHHRHHHHQNSSRSSSSSLSEHQQQHLFSKSKPKVNGKVIIVHEKPWQANHLYHYYYNNNHHSNGHVPPTPHATSLEDLTTTLPAAAITTTTTTTTTTSAELDSMSPRIDATTPAAMTTTNDVAVAAAAQPGDAVPIAPLQELLQMQQDLSLQQHDVTEEMAIRAQELWKAISAADPTPPTDDPTTSGGLLHDMASAVTAVVSIWTNTNRLNWILQAQDVVVEVQRSSEWYADTLEPHQRFEVHLPILQAWARRGDGARAQTWLNRMRDSNQQYKMNVEYNDNEDMTISTTAHNLVLEAWTKHAYKQPKRLDRIFGLFQHMQKQGQVTPMSYLMLLTALSKLERRKKLDELPRARELMEQYCRQTWSSAALQNNTAGSFDSEMFRIMMEMEAHVGDGPRTEALLRQMQQRHDSTKDDELPKQVERLAQLHYHIAMHAWTRNSIQRSDDDRNSLAVDRVLALFQEMKATATDSEHESLSPSRRTYALLIEAFCRHRPLDQNQNGEWAHQAQGFWEEMLRRYHDEGDLNCRPTTQTSFPLVWGWADLARADMVETILQELWRAQVTPRLHEYRAALQGWSRSNDPQAPERIKRLIDELWRRSREEGHDHLTPNRSIHASAIETLAARNQRDAVQKAQGILQAMWDRSEQSGDKTLQPSLSECHLVLKALARFGDGPAADEVLQQMRKWKLEPDRVCLEAAVAAWSGARQPEARQRGNSLLSDMKKKKKTTTKSEIQRHPNQHIPARQKAQKVDALSVTAPAKLQQDATGSDANVTQLQPLSQNQVESFILPQHMTRAHQDVESYNNALEELVQNRDPSPMAQALFEEMQQRFQELETHLKPNVVSYHAVISALVRRRNREAVNRAYEIFQDMMSMARLGDNQLQPSAELYSIMLQALSSSGDAERCQALLEQMVLDSSWDQDCPVPESRLFNIVVAAWSRSNRPDAGERGEQVLRWMQTLVACNEQRQPMNICLDNVAYSTAMKAWAAACEHNPQQALARAEALLQELLHLWNRTGKAEYRPTVLTFLSLASVVAKSSHLGDDDKSRRFRMLLQQMKDLNLEIDAKTQAALKQMARRRN